MTSPLMEWLVAALRAGPRLQQVAPPKRHRSVPYGVVLKAHFDAVAFEARKAKERRRSGL